MAKSRVTGGKAWGKFLKNAYRSQRATMPLIEVGFGDARINVLAVQLEYGDPASDLPERAAFRMGVQDMGKAVLERVEAMKSQDAHTGRLVLSAAQARELAVLGRDTIRRAYHAFHGAELSERQKLRKAGSQYADDQLVGSEGPRLISHIHGYVDGREVG